MSTSPAITSATVDLNLTYADGTTKAIQFQLDDKDEGQPIRCDLAMSVDIVDVTDVSVDSSRRVEPGQRQMVDLSIGGRGPRVRTADVTRTREEQSAINVYAIALADSAIEGSAEDDMNEDGEIAEHLHEEACHLAIDIGHGLSMWPAVALDLAARFREHKATAGL